MAHNYPKWPKNDARIYALFVSQSLSLSRTRSELSDWLTRPLLGSPRRGSVGTLYATLLLCNIWMTPNGILFLESQGRCFLALKAKQERVKVNVKVEHLRNSEGSKGFGLWGPVLLIELPQGSDPYMDCEIHYKYTHCKCDCNLHKIEGQP